MDTKKIAWEGTTWKELSACSKAVSRKAGYELFQVQCGEEPSDCKPMTSIGKGVKEIRIHDKNEYRIIYVAKFIEAIYVLHVFEKKTQKTPTKDIELAKQRYKNVIDRRKRQ